MIQMVGKHFYALKLLSDIFGFHPTGPKWAYVHQIEDYLGVKQENYVWYVGRIFEFDVGESASFGAALKIAASWFTKTPLERPPGMDNSKVIFMWTWDGLLQWARTERAIELLERSSEFMLAGAFKFVFFSNTDGFPGALVRPEFKLLELPEPEAFRVETHTEPEDPAQPNLPLEE